MRFNRAMLQHRIILLLIERARTRRMSRHRPIKRFKAMTLDFRQYKQKTDT
jgi:hypothetical protein